MANVLSTAEIENLLQESWWLDYYNNADYGYPYTPIYFTNASGETCSYVSSYWGSPQSNTGTLSLAVATSLINDFLIPQTAQYLHQWQCTGGITNIS